MVRPARTTRNEQLQVQSTQPSRKDSVQVVSSDNTATNACSDTTFGILTPHAKASTSPHDAIVSSDREDGSQASCPQSLPFVQFAPSIAHHVDKTENGRENGLDDNKHAESSDCSITGADPSDHPKDEAENDFLLGEAERLVAFTDATVAIGMTLLILPLMDASNDADGISTSEFFSENRLRFGNFLISFWVVYLLWIAHDRLFRYVRVFTMLLLRLNFLWMLCVVFVPVATNISNNLEDDGKYALKFVPYMTSLFVARLSIVLMAIEVSRDKRIWKGNRGPKRIDLVGFVVEMILLAIAFVIAVMVPDAGYFSLFVLLAARPIMMYVRWKWPDLDR